MGKTLFLKVGVFSIVFLLGSFFFTSYLGRLFYPFYFKEEIISQAETYDFDPCFIAALIRVESKFNPYAISKRGACGLMQVMPSTAAWIVEKKGWEPLEEQRLFDSDVNIKLGVWYLDNLCQEFIDLAPVLAAYNAGRGNVKQWLEGEIWDGSLEDLENIPFAETRAYVRKVWQTYEKYRRLYKETDKRAII